MLTHERLKHFLSYELETGVFTRVAPCRGVRVGDPAGRKTSHGYWRITIDKKTYAAHRLAWFYVHGVWPVGDVDHMNGNRQDNRIANLREATRSLNMQNLHCATRANKTGLLGVSPHVCGFRAVIVVNRKQHSLGVHATPELAHSAYLAAKRVLHAGSTL